MYMYEGSLGKNRYLYLYDSVTKTIYDEYLILNETRVNNFLNSLSHPCMYKRGSIRGLEGVVELRRIPLLA